MSTMSRCSSEDLLGDSWVDVTGDLSTPGSLTPHQITSDGYLKLLREAQRDSTQSSALVSLAGSRRGSLRGSPKSPPNSPVQQGVPLHLEWHSYYVNSEAKTVEESSDWSSRPDQLPPKMWGFRTPKGRHSFFGLHYGGDEKSAGGFDTRKGLYALLLTNIISLLLGAGLGLWFSRHNRNVFVMRVH